MAIGSGSRAAAVVALGLAAACGGAPPAVLANQAGAAVGVRAIDWQNRGYPLAGLGEIRVVAGHADFVIGDDGKLAPTGEPNASYDVQPPVFADVDGDGREDAIIVGALATGGTGRFSDIRIYSLRSGAVGELAAIPGGDRGDGGIRKVSVDGRAVIVERNVLAEGDGVCCASGGRRERWVWQAGALAEDEAARRPL